MAYTDTHDPLYAYMDLDLGPVWTVVWVWPEKRLPGGPLTKRCAHRHRVYDQAVACAKSVYPALGEIRAPRTQHEGDGMPKSTFHFTVSGSGRFPLHMLCYDGCWPFQSIDSERIEGSIEQGPPPLGYKEIRLEGIKKPTVDRWRSFGWNVVEG